MSENKKTLLFESTFTLTNFLLKEWTRIVDESVSQRGRCCVALSGGKTPVEFYSRLSQLEEFDHWHKTHIFQVDERFVDAQDSENNFRTIRENLLNYVPIPETNVHPMDTGAENVLVASDDYKNKLLYFFNSKTGELPRFDLMILGCGEDGHVASLHFGLDSLNDPKRIVVPVTDSYFKNERISLSLPVINSARNIFFIIQGRQKADVVKRVIEEKADLVATKVKPHDGELTFFIDRFAASKLTSPTKITDQGGAISIN